MIAATNRWRDQCAQPGFTGRYPVELPAETNSARAAGDATPLRRPLICSRLTSLRQHQPRSPPITAGSPAVWHDEGDRRPSGRVRSPTERLLVTSLVSPCRVPSQEFGRHRR